MLGLLYYFQMIAVGFFQAALTNVAMVQSVFKRCGEVFNMEEQQALTDDNLPAGTHVRFDRADVSWGFKLKKDGREEDTEDTDLGQLHFTVNAGDCLAVVGKVGCGKTTLLNAVMRELIVKKGVG